MEYTAEAVLDTISERVAWESLAAAFRRACSLYHRGMESEAVRMLKEDLPSLIADWSEGSGLDGSSRKRRLLSLFMEEGRRVGEISLLQKMISAEMNVQSALTRNARSYYFREGGFSGSIVNNEL